MFKSHCGPARARALRLSVIASTIGMAALALSGCSSAQQHYAAADAAIAPKIAQATSVEIEDDGLPSQSPPPVRVRAAPDDPTEPFSRNYGGSNPSAALNAIEPEPSTGDYATLHVPARHAAARSADTTPHHATPDVSTTRYMSESDAPATIPADLPPMFRQKLVAAMTDNE